MMNESRLSQILRQLNELCSQPLVMLLVVWLLVK